jgi:soluble lytic murein transglycosylase-like protein
MPKPIDACGLSCVLLLLACAGRAEVQRAPRFDGDVHDSADEWNADNRAAFAVESRQSSRSRRVERFVVYEPEPESLVFTSSVLARSRSVQPIVYAASRTHAIPPDLVNGIIWVESRFQLRARSPKGACGLMQIMPRTAQEVARALGLRYQPYDPEFNIHAGTYYFARMVERFDGNLTLALAAYNIGPGRVDQWLRESQPLPGHSRAYVGNVFSAARAFRGRD